MVLACKDYQGEKSTGQCEKGGGEGVCCYIRAEERPA